MTLAGISETAGTGPHPHPAILSSGGRVGVRAGAGPENAPRGAFSNGLSGILIVTGGAASGPAGRIRIGDAMRCIRPFRGAILVAPTTHRPAMSLTLPRLLPGHGA